MGKDESVGEDAGGSVVESAWVSAGEAVAGDAVALAAEDAVGPPGLSVVAAGGGSEAAPADGRQAWRVIVAGGGPVVVAAAADDTSALLSRGRSS